jgi:hypothetical protein
MKFADRVYLYVNVRIIFRINLIYIKSSNNFDIKLLLWLIIYALCREGVWRSRVITPPFLGRQSDFKSHIRTFIQVTSAFYLRSTEYVDS